MPPIGMPTQNGVVLAIEQANKRGFAGGTYQARGRACSTMRCKANTIRRRRAKRQDVHRRQRGPGDGRPVQLQRRQGGDPADQRRRARADLAVEHQRRPDASATMRKSCAPRTPTSTRYFRVCTNDTQPRRRAGAVRPEAQASRKSSSSTTTRRTARASPTVSKRRSNGSAARCSVTSTSPPTKSTSRRC